MSTSEQPDNDFSDDPDMTDTEIKEVVRKYILNGHESNNADGLHEQDEFYSSIGQDSEKDLNRAYELYRTAKVTVTWE